MNELLTRVLKGTTIGLVVPFYFKYYCNKFEYGVELYNSNSYCIYTKGREESNYEFVFNNFW